MYSGDGFIQCSISSPGSAFSAGSAAQGADQQEDQGQNQQYDPQHHPRDPVPTGQKLSRCEAVGHLLAAVGGVGVAVREAILPELLQICRQRVPFLQFISVFVIENAIGKICHRGAVGLLRLQGQQPHGFAFHRAQHLGGVHPRHHPVEGGIVDAPHRRPG